ncbi:MAG TPA: serine/threonine protein kinase, partial [Anaerolineae bacterium]|nr:serine/threonine protein kinase [Anaerolineae bacterium]
MSGQAPDNQSIESKIFKPGQMVGPYVITRWIPGGRGGMATVYQARLHNQGEPVALKVAHVGLGDFLKDEAAFLRILDLDHPHIIKILPVPLGGGSTEYIVRDPASDSWYFAMEYMAGGSLEDWLRRRKRLTLEETVKVVRQVGSALDAAHRLGVLHLDVKPSNILFAEDPQKTDHIQAVLTDFGIARPRGRVGGRALTLTIEYASPEQARRAQGEEVQVDHRSDLYSLGVLVYEMLCGRVPFRGRNDEKVLRTIVTEEPPLPVKGLPDEVNRILAKALAKDPEERYQSARDLVNDLEALLPADARPRRRPILTLSFNPLLGILLGFLLGLALGIPLGRWTAALFPETSPTPTATITPTFSATPLPTDTLTPSITPSPTTPPPTALPALKPTHTATATATATETLPPPTSTRRPTNTPTRTPKPTR